MKDIRKSPEYQTWRREVRQRDGNTCRVCRVQRNLHVHHIKPLEKYPEFAIKLDNGITLCGNCHAFLSRKEESTNLQTLIEAITGQQDIRTAEQLKRLSDKFADHLDPLLKSSDYKARTNAVYKLFVHLQIYPDSLDQFLRLIEHILHVKSEFGEGLTKQIVIEFLENHSNKAAAQVISKYESWCYREAENAYSQEDYATALKKLKPLAERGHVGSQHLLGVMYGNGTGVDEDYEKAIKWSRKAAQQGYDRAQCNLGIIYKHGKGVDRDDVEAVKWFRKAAEQGYDRAQFSLGWMYRRGEGVDQNNVEAAKWFRKAAEQGYDRAQYLLGQMYREGRGVSKDDAEAVEWYREAAEQGYDRAQYIFGRMYGNGTGVDKDYEQAIKWYRKAAEQGHDRAQAILVLICDAGIMGVDKDNVKAAKWYSLYGNSEDGEESDETDLQGISITRKDFFQRLSTTGIELCLSILETNDARIEIKDNRFTLSDVGKPAGYGMSAPLNGLFDQKVEQETKPHLLGVSEQLSGVVFLSKEDIPLLRVILAGIRSSIIKSDVLVNAHTILASINDKLNKANVLAKSENLLMKAWNDVTALQYNVIPAWRDEALRNAKLDEEIINHLTNGIETEINGIKKEISQFLEALDRLASDKGTGSGDLFRSSRSEDV